MSKAKNKILAVASPGGHWIQLNIILEKLVASKEYEVIYVSAGKDLKEKVAPAKYYSVVDANSQTKLKLVILAVQLLFILLKERPRSLISTGAALGAISLLIARKIGVFTIWIDSIANIESISKSGKIVLNHSDVFLSQWEKFSQHKKINYKGSVL